MLSCALIDPVRFPSELMCGIETGLEGSLHDECRARGVRMHLEPSLVRRTHPWLDLKALLRISGFLRRGRYDVVHTHSSKAGIVGRIAARMAGVPVVVHTLHGLAFHEYQSGWKNRFYVAVERFCAPMSQRLPPRERARPRWSRSRPRTST